MNDGCQVADRFTFSVESAIRRMVDLLERLFLSLRRLRIRLRDVGELTFAPATRIFMNIAQLQNYRMSYS
jgi:hypothetical protein